MSDKLTKYNCPNYNSKHEYKDGGLITYYLNNYEHIITIPHRLDGPAYIYTYTNKSSEFYYHILGELYTAEKYLKFIQEFHPQYFPQLFANLINGALNGTI